MAELSPRDIIGVEMTIRDGVKLGIGMVAAYLAYCLLADVLRMVAYLLMSPAGPSA